MSKICKTPVMILQELAQKYHWAPPEYNIVNCITGSHINKYDFEVSVHNIVAGGTGPSKQLGKHNAAYNALQLLKDLDLFNEEENPIQKFGGDTNTTVLVNETSSNIHMGYINELRDICMEYKLADPFFEEISGTGPAHAREFTYQCTVSSIKTEATAGTKKVAKQMAAQKLLERVKEIIPQLQSESTSIPFQEVTSKINELKLFDEVIENKSISILDYTEAIPNLIKERYLTKEDFLEYFNKKDMESFETLLNKLDLRHQFKNLSGKNCVIVSLSISCDVPFTLIGLGSTEEEAKQDALSQAFRHIEVYIKSM